MFVSRQPFGQQRRQARAARLERGEPDRFEHRQQGLGIILARPPQEHGRRTGRRRLGAQGADGRLAVIAQQGHGLIEQLTLVLASGAEVLAAQFGQHFLFGWLTHLVVHAG